MTVALAACSIAVGLSVAGTQQPASDAWKDPTKHDVRFVTVDQGVQLEVLDWGGSGRPVVLLTGSGHTAHVYDEFAPKLTDCCHVYGITRRGFGASSRPQSGYDDQRLADDVFRVVEDLKLSTSVLVGHSMAGGEMTTVARQHSDRLAGAVYLDAIADLEDDPPADKEWAALQQRVPPDVRPAPTCPPTDRSSFSAYQKSLACSRGFTFPESELRNQFESVNGAVGHVTAPDWVMRSIGQQQVYRKDYSNITVPLLFLLELPRFPEDYHPKSDADRALVEQFVDRGRVLVNRWIDKAKRSVRDVRVVGVPDSGHYLWITCEPVVLREIHAFIASLPADQSK